MKMNKGNWFTVMLNIVRVALKMGFVFLDVLLSFASEKRRPRYTAIHAHELHQDGAISDQEYMRSVHGRD
ncbi:hypothetical protein [Legionella sp. CNM-4043-24]|uniref:hypothetical protein n=1 Tax=Legionella sp. CNM-4043-24 TaxID=3421646 RepID=UPI00403AB9AA